MTLSLSLSLSPAAPVRGGTLTATYVVTGEPTPAPISVNGSAVVDGVTLAATVNTTFSNTEKFNAPTAPGLTFVATADPHVWTATIPNS